MNRTLITNIDNVIINDTTIRCSAVVVDAIMVHGYGPSLDWLVFTIPTFEPGYDLDTTNDIPKLTAGKSPNIFINKSNRIFELKIDHLTGGNTREQTWKLLDERVRQYWPRGRMFPTLKREILEPAFQI